MRLKEGTKAPDLEATNWDGTRVKLSDYRDKKVWLAFFRYASCPLCNLRVHDMIQRQDELKGLSILAVFQSPPESIAEYVGKQEPPFPLLSDPEEKLYKLYGLESGLGAFVSPKNLVPGAKATRLGFLPGRMEGTKTRIPGDFLIGPDGVIQKAFYGEVISDHIPFEDAVKFAQK
ncbi:MAG: peroxiredoxin-like family protein [Bdellovibrionota bacterium]